VEPTKKDNVVKKFDAGQLAEHQANLDAAYRSLQRAYKILTFEVGRLEDEPGLALLGPAKATQLTALAEKLQSVGQELKQFANGEQDEEALESGPQGAD
jgi:hypothetical protein